MKLQMKKLQYFVSTLALSCALGLVGIAQTTAGSTAAVQAAKPAAPDHIAMMVTDWTRAKSYTKEYLDAMPEDGTNFKPNTQDKDMRTFAEQMLHLATNLYMLGSIATGATNPYQGKNLEKMDEFKANKAALTKAVMDSYDFMIGCVKGMDMAKAGEPLKLFNRFDTTRIGAIAAAFEHQTHHRGQTTVYIRMKGVKPPQERLF